MLIKSCTFCIYSKRVKIFFHRPADGMDGRADSRAPCSPRVLGLD